MDIFISHISTEAPLALVIKDWIETTFTGNIDVFVSSDNDNIPIGSKWLDEISSALSECKILIILCSPAAMTRPWIHFEAGCGWVKQIPVMTICHSGLSKSKLPSPLSALQGKDITDESFSTDFFESLKIYLDVKKLPKIDHQAFQNDIDSALKQSLNLEKPFASIHIQNEQKTHKSDLHEKEIQILEFLSDGSKKHLSPLDISRFTGIKELEAEHYLKKLYKKGLLINHLAANQPVRYSLSDDGRELIIENNFFKY